MSVYSGFATRNQEMVYDSLIGNLLAAMALRIVKFYKQEAVDEKKFRGVVEHQHKYLKKLEKRKVNSPINAVLGAKVRLDCRRHAH